MHSLGSDEVQDVKLCMRRVIGNMGADGKLGALRSDLMADRWIRAVSHGQLGRMT